MGRIFDFVANCSDGVYAVDRNQSIVLWNQSATRILGYRREEVLGQACYKIICGRDAEGCATCRRGCDAIEAAGRLELTPTIDMLVRTKLEKNLWLNVSTVVVPSKRQELSVLVHMFREVTNHQHLVRVVREFAQVVSRLSPEDRANLTNGAPAANTSLELTRREREVLGHLATGESTAEIAELLCVSPRTVRNHVGSILNKLGVRSRLEAVTYSIHNGLV